MDQRKLYILSAILRSYIQNAEPIGSRSLQRDYSMNISAATIRNEMSDLEHLGYLVKEHTSSGRVPSELAYRWYVDALFERGIDESTIPALSSTSLLYQSADLDTLLRGALDLLAQSSNCIAFATIPTHVDDAVQKIEWIPLNKQEAVIVLVYGSKTIRTELIRFREAHEEVKMRRAGEVLQKILSSRSIQEVEELLDSGLLGVQGKKNNLFAEALSFLREEVRSRQQMRLLFSGLNRAFGMPEFGNTEDVQHLLRSLRDVHAWEDLLREPVNSLRVYIGSESKVAFLEKGTVILAPYYTQSGMVGKIGMIAPKRLDYPKAMVDVAQTARYVSSIANRR